MSVEVYMGTMMHFVHLQAMQVCCGSCDAYESGPGCGTTFDGTCAHCVALGEHSKNEQ